MAVKLSPEQRRSRYEKEIVDGFTDQVVKQSIDHFCQAKIWRIGFDRKLSGEEKGRLTAYYSAHLPPLIREKTRDQVNLLLSETISQSSHGELAQLAKELQVRSALSTQIVHLEETAVYQKFHAIFGELKHDYWCGMLCPIMRAHRQTDVLGSASHNTAFPKGK